MTGLAVNFVEKKAPISISHKSIDVKHDFKEIHHVSLEEVLTQEELDDGMTPMMIDYTIGLTAHALNRMYNTEYRWCDYQLVENLLCEKRGELASVMGGEEFLLLSKNRKLAIVCAMYQDRTYGNVIAVITVIRNVVVGENNYEYEEQVRLKNDNRRIY